VAEERRLGEDLDVRERRTRLERDRPEFFGPVELAGGIHVEDRDREDDAAGEAREPAADFREGGGRPPAVHVVGLVDRLEQPFEMRRGGRLGGGAEQDERLGDEIQGLAEPLVEPRGGAVDGDDEGLERPVLSPEPRDARLGDGGRRLGVRAGVGEQDQGRSGPPERLAVEMRLEGIDRVGGRLGEGHRAPVAGVREPAGPSSASHALSDAS
jgi:hypothetical protein